MQEISAIVSGNHHEDKVLDICKAMNLTVENGGALKDITELVRTIQNHNCKVCEQGVLQYNSRSKV